MDAILKRFSSTRYAWVAALGVMLGMFAASFILPGGDDLYRYYQPFGQGCWVCGYVPFYTQWFLWPLLLVGHPFTWPLWTLICLSGFYFLLRYTRVNPLLFLISFPMLGQVWLGQIDILVCAGVVIFLLSKNPYLRGIGMLLALVKPQLSFLAIFMLLLQEPRRDLWKVFLVPVVAIFASLILYGFTWPVTWIQNAINELPGHVWRLAGSAVWPYGLLLVPVPFLFQEKRKRLEVSLLVSSIALPFVGVYSYIVFLILDTRWWMVVLSFLWLAAYPFLKANAMQYAWILPFTILFVYSLEELRKRRLIMFQEKEGSHA